MVLKLSLICGLSLASVMASAQFVPSSHERWSYYAYSPYGSTNRLPDLQVPLAGKVSHDLESTVSCTYGTLSCTIGSHAMLNTAMMRVIFDVDITRRGSTAGQQYYYFQVSRPTTVVLSSVSNLVPVHYGEYFFTAIGPNGGSAMASFRNETNSATVNLVPGVTYRFGVSANRYNVYDAPEITESASFDAMLYAVGCQRVPIGLGDFLGAPENFSASVEVWQNGSMVENLVNLGVCKDSEFSFAPVTRGSVTLRVKVGHWLSAIIPGVTIGDAMQGLPWTYLFNGDVDEDNEVGPGDFGALSSAFGSVDGDTNWNAMADLDGDGEVGPSDFGILSANFGVSGD